MPRASRGRRLARWRLLLLPPWRRAPVRLLASFGLFLSVVVAALVLGIAAAARPLYSASSGSASLREDLTKGCASDVGLRIKQVAALSSTPIDDPAAPPSVELGAASTAIESAVRGIAGLGPSVVTIFGEDATVGAGGKTDTVQLLSRTGADAHLDVLSSVTQPGVWLSRTTAAALGVVAGGTVDLQLPAATVPLVVHGVFTDLIDRRDASWCALERQILGPLTSANPPVLIVDQDELVRALQAGGVLQRVAWWEVTPDRNRWTLPVAQRAVPMLKQVASDAPNPTTALGRALAAPIASVDPQASLEHAQEATVTGSATVGPIVLGAIGVAVLVLIDAARTWTERRRQELLILHLRGAGSALIGAKGLLELAPPIVGGAAMGVVSGYWLVRWLGPWSALPPEAVHDAVVAVGVATAVALAAVTITVVLATRSRHGALAAPRAVGALPVSSVLVLAVAGAAYYELRTRGSSIVRSDRGSHVDAFVLLFPVLLIAGLSALASWIVLRPRLLRRLSRRLPVGSWLGVRRLATHRRRAALVVTATAVAVGSVTLAASLSSTLRATIHGKATLGLGATQVVPLDGPGAPAPGSPLERASTLVLRANEATVVVAGHDPADVIAIDPATFRRAAYWDASFSSQSLAALVRSVALEPDANGVAALAIGAGLPDRFSLTLPTGDGRVDIPVHVVARPRAFPGLGYSSNRPLVVINAAALGATGVTNERQLWVAGDDPHLLDKVHAAGLDAIVVRRATSRILGNLQPQLWALDFLAVLGAVTGMVALSGLGLYHAAIGRRRLVGDVVSSSLGLSRRSALVASAIEAGAMLAAGLVLGVGSSWLAVTLVYRRLDPAPESPPTPLYRVDVASAALGLAAVIVLALVVALVLDTRRRRASIDEVLRNAG